ncbi:hypothetical protein AG1IA_08854 [Rhizoctonia solani AG-1 IA]|uniref:Uncharacterized protein n=1 Tax=Thanatephorus cucumeris (strain AG1-IA) TaxID=983506 RepID=L8WK44_THACA|nr:hypothetical protein AG1IA_08854 [Rhizoctonia solani AG-1 IA]
MSLSKCLRSDEVEGTITLPSFLSSCPPALECSPDAGRRAGVIGHRSWEWDQLRHPDLLLTAFQLVQDLFEVRRLVGLSSSISPNGVGAIPNTIDYILTNDYDTTVRLPQPCSGTYSSQMDLQGTDFKQPARSLPSPSLPVSLVYLASSHDDSRFRKVFHPAALFPIMPGLVNTGGRQFVFSHHLKWLNRK